jgi:hypothetical protein
MWFMHRVMLHGAALALPALLATQALAQGTQPKEPDRTTGSGVRMEEPSVPPAPIGHRQPRPSDVPATRERDPSDVWLNRLNRETDRKLQICRDC